MNDTDRTLWRPQNPQIRFLGVLRVFPAPQRCQGPQTVASWVCSECSLRHQLRSCAKVPKRWVHDAGAQCDSTASDSESIRTAPFPLGTIPIPSSIPLLWCDPNVLFGSCATMPKSLHPPAAAIYLHCWRDRVRTRNVNLQFFYGSLLGRHRRLRDPVDLEWTTRRLGPAFVRPRFC